MTGSSRWRDGVRFPSDVNGIPSGASGPVTTYYVSKEEIERRFGPPKKESSGAESAKAKEGNTAMQTAKKTTGDNSGPVAELIRAEAIEPHFMLGRGSIRVADLPAKAEALCTLLGPEAVLTVENGVLVVRAR